MSRRDKIERVLLTKRFCIPNASPLGLHMFATSRKNDNLTALAMQAALIRICEGIESDDTIKIAENLVDLKKLTADFEDIFVDNLANGCYRH